ncbi:MAG: ribosome maturation factor RimM [Bacilli bacterium]|nr:ribosome maturation factor RimM [Bacilli bacterium]
MEDFIYVGKIVNTHGIRGEIRLLSDFDKKENVFVPNMTLYLGRKKEPVTITSYRHHKNFEMVCLEGYNDINDVLRFKGLYAYVLREDLKLKEDELLEEDYIGMEAWK